MQKIDGHSLLGKLNSIERQGIDYISNKLDENGFECYLVGGCVRDLILNQHLPGDIDLTTNAHPGQIEKLFQHTIPTGIEHGTMTIILNKIGYEITTYRSESEYSDARRPDMVKYSRTLAEDLSRRDFTMNAICIAPGSGDIIDLHNGIQDIRDKIIRTIGKPHDRFFEDGLRPIRACRFMATLEFNLTKDVKSCLRDTRIHKRSENIAIERFSDELWKGFKAKNTGRMISELEKSELLYLFIKKEKYTQLLATCDDALNKLNTYMKAKPEFKMAVWFWYIQIRGKEDIVSLSQSLKFSKKQTDKIRFFQKYIVLQIDMKGIYESAGQTIDYSDPKLLYAVRLFLSAWKSHFGETKSLELLGSIPGHDSDTIPVDLMIKILQQDPLVIRDLALTGKILMSHGIQGPEIGVHLRKALDFILHHPLKNNQATLLKIILETRK